MADNKSLVEEALLQMKNLEQVVAENAKGILASTMKEEISELVKESLKEAEEEEIEMAEMDEQEEDILGIEMDSEESDDEEEIDGEVESDDEESEDEIEIDMDSEEEDDELPMDLTGASDEEILKVFKAMSDEDGIIVTQDDNQVHIEDEDDDVEYIIQMEGDEEEDVMEEDDMEDFETEVMVDDEFGDESDDTISDEELDAMIADIFNDEMEEGYDHYRDAEKDDAAHIRDLELDMKHDAEHTEEWNEGDKVVYEIEIDEDDMDDEADLEFEVEDEEEDVNENKMTIKPVMGNLKKAKLTTKAETKESAIEPKGKAKGVGMNLSAKKYEFSEEEMEEGKDWGSNKHEYRRKKVDGIEKKAGEGKDGHYKDYEGKFGGNKGDKSKTHPGKKDYEKAETKEASRTYGFGSKKGRGLRKAVTPNRNLTFESVNQEVQRLRDKNEEYRKALNVFREKLQEVAVFNSNLAYATRLFTEHTTTKQEKINILRRFDNVETLKESKNLYSSIKNELNSLTSDVVTESVSKIEKSPASGSAQSLIESKTYENPQFLRMKDIMAKIAK